jgi:glycosyltransferase involved in cell wall biosynthesis
LIELHIRLTKVISEIVEDDNYEIIYVDDASPVDCWKILIGICAGDAHVRAIQLVRNVGQAQATIAGIAASTMPYVVTIDDDLQHPPEAIPSLTNALTQHPAIDVIIAVPRQTQQPAFRRIGSRLVNRMNTVLLQKPLNLRFSGFRILRGEIAKSLVGVRLPSPALGPLILRTTTRVQNIEFEHQQRAIGKSNYTLKKLVKQTLGNAIGFSMLPLQILAFLGLIGLAITGIITGILTIRFLMNGVSLPGYMSIALVLFGLSAFNFLAFGIIGEYLIRILHASGDTPPYIVRETSSSIDKA